MAVLGRFGEYFPQAVVSFFYVSDVAKAIGYDLGYVGHTWSLALEEQFYLLWPALLIFLPRRFLAPVAIGGIVVAVALQFLLVPDDILAHFRPDVRADAVLWGCLIALVPAALKMPRWATVAAFAGVILVSFTPFPWPHAIAVSSVLSAVFIAGAATLAPALSVAAARADRPDQLRHVPVARDPRRPAQRPNGGRERPRHGGRGHQHDCRRARLRALDREAVPQAPPGACFGLRRRTCSNRVARAPIAFAR